LGASSLIWQLIKQVADAVEAGALLIDRLQGATFEADPVHHQRRYLSSGKMYRTSIALFICINLIAADGLASVPDATAGVMSPVRAITF
jgi:hypothetical protein